MQGGKVSEGNLKYFKLLNKKNGNDFYGQKNVQVWKLCQRNVPYFSIEYTSLC